MPRASAPATATCWSRCSRKGRRPRRRPAAAPPCAPPPNPSPGSTARPRSRGTSWTRATRSRRTWARAAGTAVLRQVCAGLHHAHELQIVHRDLKPENIMLVMGEPAGDRAVVLDFGLAKERRADPAIAKLTATGIILGTPEFMSPEQIRGKQLDARSDIYALGIVAFEMFTG